MKFTVEKATLLNALKKVSGIISNRPPSVAILAHLLLEIKDGHMVITGADSDQSITTRIPVTVGQAGAITAPARKLVAIVSKFSESTVSFEADESRILRLSSGRSQFRLQSLDPAQFPRRENPDHAREFLFKAPQLLKMLGKISYAISHEDNKGAMNGLLLSISQGTFTAVATDGRRLALMESVISSDDSLDGDTILPLKAVNELQKIFSGSSDIKISIGDSQAAFASHDTTYRTRLLDGIYPNYRQVVPQSFSQECSMPRTELHGALDLVSQILDLDSNNSVRISMQQSEATIQVTTNAETAACHIPIIYNGEDIETSFNIAFLMDPLKFLECNNITLRFNDRYSPMGLYGDEGFLYVIMPLRF